MWAFSLPMFIVLMITILAIDIIALLTGILSVDHKIPFGGSCSWVISAASHPANGTKEDPTKEVRWGVVPGSLPGHDGIGHCYFSNGKVEKRRVWKMYK